MSVAIIDYGVGNLFSLASSLHYQTVCRLQIRRLSRHFSFHT